MWPGLYLVSRLFPLHRAETEKRSRQWDIWEGDGWTERRRPTTNHILPETRRISGDYCRLTPEDEKIGQDGPGAWQNAPCESEKPVVNRIFIGLYHSGQSPPRQPNLNLSGRLRPPRSLPRFLDIVKGSHERQVVEVGRRGASLLRHESSGEDGLEGEDGTGLLDIL